MEFQLTRPLAKRYFTPANSLNNYLFGNNYLFAIWNGGNCQSAKFCEKVSVLFESPAAEALGRKERNESPCSWAAPPPSPVAPGTASPELVEEEAEAHVRVRAHGEPRDLGG